jgi:hypothetical protein
VVHACTGGTTDQTLCGVPLSRSVLRPFSHLDWADVQLARATDAGRVVQVCPRCAAAMGRRCDEDR